MLLAVDIGNTNITCGVFTPLEVCTKGVAVASGDLLVTGFAKSSRILKRFKIATQDYRGHTLKKSIDKFDVEEAVVCSVVPDAGEVLEKDLIKILHKSPFVIGKNINVPIKNLYKKPSQVGQDRLVNAYGCVELYGFPAIVVDFGTAITFDVISKRAEYLGGIIVPGLELSLDTLSKKAALLPKIALKKPESLIGRDTVNSMRSGVVYGISALTDGLIKKLKAELGRAIVIATGGNADFIARFCSSIDEVDKDLTLKGLSLIYTGLKKNLKKFKKSKK